MIIKTVMINGTVQTVDGLADAYTSIQNNCADTLYVSASPDVVPDADGVLPIASGKSAVFCTRETDTLYMLGHGRAVVVNKETEANCFDTASSGSSSGGEIVPDLPLSELLIKCEIVVASDGSMQIVDVSGAKYYGVMGIASIGPDIAELVGDTYADEHMTHIGIPYSRIADVPESGKIAIGGEYGCMLYTSNYRKVIQDVIAIKSMALRKE